MGSCQYETDATNYMGAEYDDIGIDEAVQFTEYQFNVIKTSLRTTRTDLSTQFYLGSNPRGVGHGWLKRNFIEAGGRPEINSFVPAKIYDNPVLMTADPDYLKTLEGLPEELRRSYLEGDWDIFSGQAFSEFRREKHVVTEFDYPLALCQRIIAYDWGFNKPGCAVWLAYTPEGRVYQYREIYATKKNVDEWANDIRTFTQIEPVEFIVLPHDCFERLGGKDSIANIFDRIVQIPIVKGRTLQRDARKNRLAILRRYMADAPDGRPWFQIHAKCTETIRTIPDLVFDEHDPEDIDTEGEDHAYDALSLGLMSKYNAILFSGAIAPPQKSKSRSTFETTPEGEIIVPDFWEAFKNLRVGGRTWEHK